MSINVDRTLFIRLHHRTTQTQRNTHPPNKADNNNKVLHQQRQHSSMEPYMFIHFVWSRHKHTRLWIGNQQGVVRGEEGRLAGEQLRTLDTMNNSLVGRFWNMEGTFIVLPASIISCLDHLGCCCSCCWSLTSVWEWNFKLTLLVVLIPWFNGVVRVKEWYSTSWYSPLVVLALVMVFRALEKFSCKIWEWNK